MSPAFIGVLYLENGCNIFSTGQSTTILNIIKIGLSKTTCHLLIICRTVNIRVSLKQNLCKTISMAETFFPLCSLRMEYIMPSPLGEGGLIFTSVHAKVCQISQNISHLFMLDWFDIWSEALSGWVLVCLPFTGLSYVYFLFPDTETSCPMDTFSLCFFYYLNERIWNKCQKRHNPILFWIYLHWTH